MNPQPESVIVEMEKAVRGKRAVIEHMLCALLAGGHILLDDMPGVGKTTLAVALCRAVDLTCRRVQFTPDVLPSDIVGFSMYDASSGQFLYRPGAATHANLLLADGNQPHLQPKRSPPFGSDGRTPDHRGRETHPLEKPFVVVATQNSVGTAGTQLLPYAQMDRFMARLSVGYPDHDAQMALLKDRLSENPLDAVSQVLTREELLAMQAEARAVQTSDALLDYITRLTMASRDHAEIEVGVSRARRAASLPNGESAPYLLGRDFAVSEDVQAVFVPGPRAPGLIPTSSFRLGRRSVRRMVGAAARFKACRTRITWRDSRRKANRLVYTVLAAGRYAALYFLKTIRARAQSSPRRYSFH
ncbi:MAG: AAA family ATPase [Oscillospiraceae bacterium]